MCDNAKDKKSNEKNIVFFFGAGCEGKDQFNLPSGPDFKKETILAKDAKALYDFLNNNSDYSPNTSSILNKNASNILYQTLAEKEVGFEIDYECFDDSNRAKSVIEEYLKLKENGESTKELVNDFKKIYVSEFCEKIEAGGKLNKNCEEFLKKACFFSYVDSLFNFIRKPERYKNETKRVMKFYYAAFLCIYNNIMAQNGKDIIKDACEKKSVQENRELLRKNIQEGQENVIKKHGVETYYHRIKKELNDFKKSGEKEQEGKNAKEDIIKVITTNYTNFAEKILELPEDNISYLHGRLEWFENLETKAVKNVDEHDEDAVIFPFIFAQSAVKPIVSPLQIKEYYKANKFMEQATEIVVLGYNFNSDDEHIVNMFREFICKEKKITFLYYVESDADDEKERNAYKTNLDKLFGENNGISLVNTKDIDLELIRIFKDCNKN